MVFYFSGTGNSQLAAKQIAAELGDELGCSKYDWTTAGTGTAAKRCAPASAMRRYPRPGIVRENLSLRC